MRKYPLFLGPFALSLGALLVGCGGADAASPMAAMPRQVAAASEAAGAPPPSAPASPSPQQPGAPNANIGAATNAAKPSSSTPASATKAKEGAPDIAQSIIYNGHVTIRAKRDDYARTIDHVIDLAESLGGAIAARRDDGVEIRVPSASFRRAMTELDGVGEVESRSVTAEDVTEEMHDLDVRLLNLKATRKRLEELLNKATNIEGTLQVERELERVAVEVDRIEGRLAYLRTHAALSTISIAFHEKPKDVVPVVVTPPPPPPPAPKKIVNIPAPWFDKVGIDPLLTVR